MRIEQEFAAVAIAPTKVQNVGRRSWANSGRSPMTFDMILQQVGGGGVKLEAFDAFALGAAQPLCFSAARRALQRYGCQTKPA
jgi:hypothetical protein